MGLSWAGQTAGNNVDLDEAYRTTRYVAIWHGVEYEARVDCPSPAIDALLDAHGAGSGVFVTAWNPRSEPRPVEENRARDADLRAELACRGVAFVDHVGRGVDADWTEEGAFALDWPLAEALAVAERFGQNAVVHVERRRPARLVFTRLGRAAVDEGDR